jgi:hypothetical protein
MYDRQLSPEFLDANPELKRLVSGPDEIGAKEDEENLRRVYAVFCVF